MAEIHRDEHSAKERDDFTKINGIGPLCAEALYRRGILYYEQLAAYSADALAELIHPEVPTVTARRIRKGVWLEQARTLADSLARASDPLPVRSGKDGQEPEMPENELEAVDPPDPWRELADFFVSYGEEITPDGQTVLKTKVHHSQAGEEIVLNGVATVELTHWMLHQAKLEKTETISENRSAQVFARHNQGGEENGDQARLHISRLWISQVETESSPGRTPQVLVRVEADVECVCPQGGDLFPPRPVSFRVDIQLINTQTGAAIFVESPLFEFFQHEPVREFLHDFPPPPMGNYQLYLIAWPVPEGPPVIVKGPLLRVT